MSEGTVGWWVIGLYLRSVGTFLTMTIIMSLILMQLSQNFTFLWLTFWVKNSRKNTTDLQLSSDNVHDNSTILDHGINIADSIVHILVNKSMELINSFNTNDIPNYAATTVTDPFLVPERQLKLPTITDTYYLEIYFGLAGLNLVFTIMRAFLFAYGGVKAAEKIHKALLKTVVKVCILHTFYIYFVLNSYYSFVMTH